MSRPEQVDNWVFDSLVNFLHGSIWKVPVLGFIEEKSVVFDPDSYNNMTEEKEEEFRKIHEGYKGVVDFMLTSFMEDLQVTPEQVEEACHVREHQSKTLPESHITKVALEQLWAAEDFTAFRRLMTRKNIDLQLQSLELLVAKYGVLSPSLRSGDSEELSGEDGEDDFLQVVIRYSDQLELFKCDYEKPGVCCEHSAPIKNATCKSHGSGENIVSFTSPHETGDTEDDNKNMRLHLAGVRFKDDVAPMPVEYQATLTSSAKNHAPPITAGKSISQRQFSKSSRLNSKSSVSISGSVEEDAENQGSPESKAMPLKSPEQDSSTTALSVAHISPPHPTPNDIPENTFLEPSQDPQCGSVGEESIPINEASMVPESKEENENDVDVGPSDELMPIEANPIDNNQETELNEEIKTEVDDIDGDGKQCIENDLPNVETEIETRDPESETEQESQLIQLEEAEAAIEEESNEQIATEMVSSTANDPEKISSPNKEESQDTVGTASEPLAESPHPQAPQAPLTSPRFDEKTAAEIASTAPEQRRLLTAVRKALEVNPEDSEPITSIDIPPTTDSDEDLQKRREYLRAQRDKLIAMKKQEREKLLLANTGGTGGAHSARPKSARAAQIAIKNPSSMRTVSLSEKSLSARRALADRLKQELIEK